jgi:SPP1 family predicted phage head-tail adaptor
MNPGILVHQIIIQIKSISQDAELNAVETWMDWRTLWAQAMPKLGKEYYKLQTINNDITEVFKTRYIAGINPRQRIKFMCKYYEIIDVINTDERNKELLITCKAVV